MAELIMEGANEVELFMAALLSCTSNFKNAKVRKLKKGEEKSLVNVTRENILNLCPSWASSELISRLIRFKVCAPVIEKPMATVDEKVRLIKSALESYAKDEGIEMPK